MKLNIHFLQINSDFSPEYAEANHGGKESENNVLYEWEDELEVSKNLADIQLKRNASFPLRVQLPDGKIVEEEISDMFLVELTLDDGQKGFMGVSESMLVDFNEEKSKENPILRIYIKDYEPFWNEMPGLYIASKEFPKNIKLHDRD